MQLKTLFFLLFIALAPIFAKPGLLEIDEINFPKIVDGTKNVLVQFTDYAWKETKDFQNVVDEFANNNEIIIAKVICHDNKKLKEKYVSDGEYPATKLFLKGKDSQSPLSYHGPEAPESIIEFVAFNLSPRLKTLKELAHRFVTEEASREAILKQAGDEVKNLSEKDAEAGNFYLIVMKKIQEKGNEFVEKEKTRISTLAASPNTKQDKKAQFAKRVAILGHFV
eukprot:TRINITY_DN1767_c0_g1_i2.p1 TRINITY_DN1767_c0_g1~~TRINITY_DN1767_c0_g1_i2.p1  ORF type:complete len:262 (-),score=103.94 TRINITY_DN1767_c0_g1_i2:89-760(-)